MPIFVQSVGRPLRIIVAGAHCFGIWGSLAIACTDYHFRQDTKESIREAIHQLPDGWKFYMHLA